MVHGVARDYLDDANDVGLLEVDPVEVEDEEDNFQFEAEKMLNSWNREELLREADDDRKRILEDNYNQVDHYDGETPFEDMILDMKQVNSTGVYMTTIEANPGGKKIAGSSTILFDRTGFLEFNQIPFESSSCDGKPSILNLAEGPIIPGLLQALLEMREGERANVVIHPAMAYGKSGSPPIIPANSFLLYNLKVHKVWDESDLEIIQDYERKLGIVLPLSDRIDCIKKQKDSAKQFLIDDAPREALIRYKAALMCLEQETEDVISRSIELTTLRSTLYLNISIILNKLKNYKSASNAAKKALLSDRNNIKAYYQLAKARMELSDFIGALKYLDKASIIAPDNRDLKDLRGRLNIKCHDEKKRRDEIMMRMSKALVG